MFLVVVGAEAYYPPDLRQRRRQELLEPGLGWLQKQGLAQQLQVDMAYSRLKLVQHFPRLEEEYSGFLSWHIRCINC